MRLFAIPDIHGRYDLLCDLLNKLDSEAKMDLAVDKLIFLGDMVDRGPDSRSVLGAIKELTEEFPGRVVALRGNHETLMLDAVHPELHKYPRIEAAQLWSWNGGDETRRSYPGGAVETSHLQWVAALPLSHEEPGFFFSHAPVPRENRRKIMDRGQPYTLEELTWTYSTDEPGVARNLTKTGIVGVCGHIHALHKDIREPRMYPHYLYLDSGCGCSPRAPLVACEVRSREVYYAWPVEAQITMSED